MPFGGMEKIKILIDEMVISKKLPE